MDEKLTNIDYINKFDEDRINGFHTTYTKEFTKNYIKALSNEIEILEKMIPNEEIFYKQYDEKILKNISNEDLLYLYRFFYSHKFIELNEWKKIERELIQRMTK
jgi:uncharacterized circularly permuted ATP-grasp superfamily protein